MNEVNLKLAAYSILVFFSWSHSNIGDIGITPGLLRLLECHIPEAQVTIVAATKADATREYLQARFPNCSVCRHTVWQPEVFAGIPRGFRSGRPGALQFGHHALLRPLGTQLGSHLALCDAAGDGPRGQKTVWDLLPVVRAVCLAQRRDVCPALVGRVIPVYPRHELAGVPGKPGSRAADPGVRPRRHLRVRSSRRGPGRRLHGTPSTQTAGVHHDYGPHESTGVHRRAPRRTPRRQDPATDRDLGQRDGSGRVDLSGGGT